eukprot:2469526-Pyramimonas_sp.AAC.1
MQNDGLAISPKSAVVCTELADAKKVVKRQKVAGFTVMAAAQTPDLGVDCGGGRRHARATRTARVARHQQMRAKVVRYARTARIYRLTSRLEQQGAAAAGAYAHQ